MKFGLSEDQIRHIRDVLSKYPKITEAVIYGSRAMGNYKEASDVDIALKGDVNASLAEKVKVGLEENTGLPFFFDVVAYPVIENPDFVEHIVKFGVSMYRPGWRESKFSQNVVITPKVPLKAGHEYSFVEMKDLEDGNRYCGPSSQRRLSGGARFQDGDTLFARITPCLENGKISQVRGLKNGVGFGSTEFFVFRGKDGFTNNDFVFYLSRSEEVRSFAEQNFDGTSGRQRVPKAAFDNLSVLFPPLPEQRAIAGVLSSLDDKIDLLHRQNKTLEGMAAALWRKMFVEEVDPHGSYGRLENIVEMNPSRPLRKGSLATYLDMGNMPTMGAFPLDWYAREYQGGMRFKNGDTILARITPCLENGKTAFVNFLGQNEIGWGSTEYIVMTPRNGVCPEWLYFLARNNDFREFAIQNMTGTSGRQRVSGDVVAQYEMLLPSKVSMEKFGVFAASIMERIRKNSLQVRTLSLQRDALLPKLITGEVAVKA